MAVHQHRNGTLRVCVNCRVLEDHDNCIANTAAFDNAVVCHCTVCHAPCLRPKCQEEALKVS